MQIDGKQYVQLNADGTVLLLGFTDEGKKITIPLTLVRWICEYSEKYRVIEDIRYRAMEQELDLDLSDEELLEIATEIVDRRDNCDVISESYQYIVDNVTEEFAEKKGRMNDGN